ncbi:hypothetical protein CsSME_00014346 [Camellia sinensis var. sinensis]
MPTPQQHCLETTKAHPANPFHLSKHCKGMLKRQCITRVVMQSTVLLWPLTKQWRSQKKAIMWCWSWDWIKLRRGSSLIGRTCCSQGINRVSSQVLPMLLRSPWFWCYFVEVQLMFLSPKMTQRLEASCGLVIQEKREGLLSQRSSLVTTTQEGNYP